jgi:hypothetical protein
MEVCLSRKPTTSRLLSLQLACCISFLFHASDLSGSKPRGLRFGIDSLFFENRSYNHSFKRRAALQATCLESGCDQSARWAHPLRSVPSDLRFQLANLVEQQDRHQRDKQTERNTNWVQEIAPFKWGHSKPPPFFSANCRLRGLGGSLGFESLLAAYVDFDLFGLGFGLLGQGDLQHALVVVRAHLS